MAQVPDSPWLWRSSLRLMDSSRVSVWNVRNKSYSRQSLCDKAMVENMMQVQDDLEILNENYGKYLEFIPRLKRKAVTIKTNVFCQWEHSGMPANYCHLSLHASEGEGKNCSPCSLHVPMELPSLLILQGNLLSLNFKSLVFSLASYYRGAHKSLLLERSTRRTTLTCMSLDQCSSRPWEFREPYCIFVLGKALLPAGSEGTDSAIFVLQRIMNNHSIKLF